jgi:hypothetical protein
MVSDWSMQNAFTRSGALWTPVGNYQILEGVGIDSGFNH